MIANLVDIDDFKGKYYLKLPTQITNAFDVIIQEVQYNILIDLMGFPIYNEFETGLGIVPIPSQWTDLRDGTTYTDYCSYLNNWQGLKYMLIPFIWTEWIENEQFKISGLGMITGKPENSDMASDFQWKTKLHDFKNEAIKRYREAYSFMYSNLEDYNDFTTFYKQKRLNQIIAKGSIR